MNIKKSFLLLTIVVSLVVLSACSPTPTSTTPKTDNVRSLSVTGSGEVYLIPDLAYINVGVQTEASTVTDALSQNNQMAQAISETLLAAGVEAKDIQTSAFNVYPMKTYDTEGQETGTKYVVDNVVYITVRDLAKLGEILDNTVKAGANSINSINFDVKDKATAKSDARRLAIENAKAQAQELAAAAGIELGDLISINVYDSGGSNVVYKSAEFAAGESEVPISAGSMLISMEANLTYAIK